MHVYPGIDRASVRDIADSVDRFGERYLNRVFTPRERAQAAASPCPLGFLTGRFAAKEAVGKSLRIPRRWPLPWTDIEIGPEPSSPGVRLDGWARAWAERNGLDCVAVSVVVKDAYAVASALANEQMITQPTTTAEQQ